MNFKFKPKTLSLQQLQLASDVEPNGAGETSEKSGLWECFDEIASSSNSTVFVNRMDSVTSFQNQPNIALDNNNAEISAEVLNYLNLPVVSRTSNPFQWWKSNKSLFPKLYRFAAKFLSAPPTSVASERLFSVGGNVYVPTRNRLLPDHAEQLMFLHCNLKLLNFDY